MNIRTKFIHLILVLASINVYALDTESIKPDQTYVLTEGVNLRKQPPRTIFHILGEKKGEVEKNDRVTVRRVKEVRTLLDGYYWLNIEKSDPETGMVKTGWIYGGKAGEQSLLEAVERPAEQSLPGTVEQSPPPVPTPALSDE